MPADAARLHAMASAHEFVWLLGNHDPLPPEGMPGTTAEWWERTASSSATRPAATAPEVCGHHHPEGERRHPGPDHHPSLLRRRAAAADAAGVRRLHWRAGRAPPSDSRPVPPRRPGLPAGQGTPVRIRPRPGGDRVMWHWSIWNETLPPWPGHHTCVAMNGSIVWFRQDLRLADNRVAARGRGGGGCPARLCPGRRGCRRLGDGRRASLVAARQPPVARRGLPRLVPRSCCAEGRALRSSPNWSRPSAPPRFMPAKWPNPGRGRRSRPCSGPAGGRRAASAPHRHPVRLRRSPDQDRGRLRDLHAVRPRGPGLGRPPHPSPRRPACKRSTAKSDELDSGSYSRPSPTGPPVSATPGTPASGGSSAAERFMAERLKPIHTGRNTPGEDLTSMLSPASALGRAVAGAALAPGRRAGSGEGLGPTSPNCCGTSSRPTCCGATRRCRQAPQTRRFQPADAGGRTRRACVPGNAARPACRSWMPACASSGRSAGCTTGCG